MFHRFRFTFFLMENMNERFNAFRSVPREEVSSEHMFRSLRHFPAISKSISSSRGAIETQRNSNLHPSSSTKWRRNKFETSTHRLDELCKSSLSEFSALSQFRKQIINDRDRPSATEVKPKSPVQTKTDPLRSGNAKLTKFAVRYDSRRMNNDLAGFSGVVLDKAYFDYQLKRCLCVYLTPEELDALFEHIDTDKGGTIDGVEFLRYFFKLGADARDELRCQLIESAAQHETKVSHEARLEKERSSYYIYIYAYSYIFL
jgi:hypothetical protein